MPNLPWPDTAVAQLSIIGTMYGQQIVTVHHFAASEASNASFNGDAEVRTWAAAIPPQWVTSCKTAYLAQKPTGYTLSLLRVQVLEVRNVFRHRLTPTEVSPGTPVAGTAGFASEEVTSAVVLRWRTALAGKRFRGRSYLGPLTTDHMADGRVTAAGTTAAAAYATAMLGRWGPTGVDIATTGMVIYSRGFNQGEYGYPQGVHPNRTFFYPPDYAGNAQQIIDSAVDPILRVQRKRQVGVGT